MQSPLCELFTFSSAGNDTIQGLEGTNIIFGGGAQDHVTAGTGRDIVVGDFGTFKASPDTGLPISFNSTSPDIGGMLNDEGAQ